MTNPVQEVRRLGQSIWYDNIRRGLLTSGELRRLIEIGVSGITSNPTIFEKAIAGSNDYDEALVSLARDGRSVEETYEALVLEDIRAAADLLRATYDRTGGVDGYASLEVSPGLAHDTEGTVAEARRLFAALDCPNVMIKVPGTPEGVLAVRRLVGQGINVNVTLIFSLDAYRQVVEAYIGGLEDLDGARGDVTAVASVASFFVSRVDTAVDDLLEARVRDGRRELEELQGKAAVANAKLAYRVFVDSFRGERFAVLRASGARVQRPLWASTGTKNTAYSDVMYVESLIGRDTVNTVPPATLTDFLEHGRAGATLERGGGEAGETMDTLEAAGISIQRVADRLLADGLKAFADSFDKLMANIADKRTRLLAGDHASWGARLGSHLPDVETALAGLGDRDVVGRLWRRDHTVWKPDPAEIANRLGWLAVTDLLCDQVPALQSFADEVVEAGYGHVVLLGMGGSSLGPEVLRQTFGSADGRPELIVLDSTLPDRVRAVADAVDPAHTLFLLSSKSGGTIEPLSLYRHFRALVERVVGSGRAGRSFVAITDPDTSLEALARESGFRRVFLNPSDIGGRYSVLSYFGLVPAALMGLDLAALLDRADCMREGCASCVPVRDNPGAWLGAAMAALALSGRDKLTLVTSPSIGSFGLWADQLIAESTGKEGKGIIPVADEPLVDPAHYGGDRLFVYLRVEGDENAGTDAAMERIESSGQPVVRLELRDRYDLGGEFYRWEFATAVAGALLGVNPFDQPNVQSAKELTARILEEYRASGELPEEAAGSAEELLSMAGPGDYMAIMVYARQSPEMDRALAGLRRAVTVRHRIATTVGYGPRFLHSTGQLHKGGPETGLYLQLIADQPRDIEMPGESYSFGVLARAQSLGDLRALRERGRRTARLRLGAPQEADVEKLAGGLA